MSKIARETGTLAGRPSRSLHKLQSSSRTVPERCQRHAVPQELCNRWTKRARATSTIASFTTANQPAIEVEQPFCPPGSLPLLGHILAFDLTRSYITWWAVSLNCFFITVACSAQRLLPDKL